MMRKVRCSFPLSSNENIATTMILLTTSKYICMCLCVCVCVCVCICVLIKLRITAQSGPVILVILCHVCVCVYLLNCT